MEQIENQNYEDAFHNLVSQYFRFIRKYNQRAEQSDRTADEEVEFQSLRHLLITIGEVLSMAMHKFDDNIVGHALDMYYRYKQLAMEGNSNARDRIMEMKPVVAASLQARIYKN